MVCEGCGVEALLMKTCRRRDGEGTGVLCDPCYGPLAGSVWIIPGQEIAAAKCDRCSRWIHPNDMIELRRGAKWDGYGGVCQECLR
jgi:hypothetical protein